MTTLWDRIEAADFAVPAPDSAQYGQEELVAGLSRALADPDPEVRDGAAYGVLATWIERGVIDGPRRIALGDEMAARFADPEIQARTFAPLVLDMLVSRGDFSETWVTALEDWYPAERDLRGHDERLGWLHAVAHGADLLGSLGCRPEVAPARMLDLAAARLLARTDHVFDQREDDRLARAVGRILAVRTELTVAQATGWLAPVAADLAGARRGLAPAHATNTVRTLRALYVLADRGIAVGPGSQRVPLRWAPELKEALAGPAGL